MSERVAEFEVLGLWSLEASRRFWEGIRSAAAVSGSQLSHYFADKDELVQAVISHQAQIIAGNQRHADLGSPAGLQAWRTMVIAQAKSSEGRGGCRSARSPDSWPKTTRGPAR